jgi:hypothetical protein
VFRAESTDLAPGGLVLGPTDVQAGGVVADLVHRPTQLG